eukprot:scaffold322680_cov32-Tisochrysis_lutea.AAC.1
MRSGWGGALAQRRWLECANMCEVCEMPDFPSYRWRASAYVWRGALGGLSTNESLTRCDP